MLWPCRRGPLRVPVTGGECAAMGVCAYRASGRRLPAGIVFGVALLLVGLGLAMAESPVASIAVEGNRRVEADTVRSSLNPQEGRRLGGVSGVLGLEPVHPS